MKTKERLMALLTTVVITGSNLLSLGGQVIAADTSLPEQNTKTNISNVQFNTYFEGNVHEKTFLIEEGGKMYIELNVQENGYLKNGTIKINNGNYTIDTKNTNSDFIQKIENEAIYLKQIQYNQKLLVELPIKFAKESKRDVFSRKSEISLNGIYVDGNGREKELKKTITNLVKWNAKPQVELNGEITKYIPYKNGEEYGLLVQAKINSGIKDNLLPISKTILEVSVPKIEEILPERVTVIANNTKATNGIENGTNFGTENYTYDKENSKITIQTNNEADSQGKIAWEEGKDEYLVTYIYTGEEIYNKTVEKLNNASQTKLTEEEIKEGKTNENAINGQISVNAKISVYEETETTVELSGNLPYAVEETKGEITDFNLISDNNISKGYIYANYAKTEKAKVGKTIEAKIETEFDLKYFASIYDINLNKQITFNMAKEKLLTDETEQDNNNNIITKQIKINETSFNKLLGTDGKIEILSSAGETIGIINTNSTKDENANFMLDISSKKINEIQIKTTSPIAEGTLEINVQKAFVTDQSFTKEQMETFEKMKIEMTGKSNITTKQLSGEIELKEPVSKANISIETKGLSTVVVNKDVDIRVVLDTSSIENALYKNPLIEIQMPSQIQKIEIKDVNLLLEDELKIKETNVIEKDGKQYIQLILEGTQTKYQTIDKTSEDSNVVSKGANIIITTDITLNPLAPSKTEEINMYYINENTNLYEETYKPQPKARTYSRATLAVEDEGEEYGKTSTGVTIVAPAGLVAAHIMSGFDDKNEPLTNISDEKKIATIKTYGESKTVKIEGNVINNNENPIENVFVLGRVPFKGNKIIDKDTSLGTTFDMPMTSKLEVNGIDSTKLKIYYSTNGEATKDLLTAANGWTENPTDLSKIKSYLIVVIGELDKAAQFTFEYEVKLPENLSHNNNSETVYKVYFDNKREDSTIGESKTSGIVGITTGAGPELKITLSSNMPKDTYYEKIVPQEERETQTNEDIRVLPDKNAAKFKAVVENTGGTTATNVVLTINNPAGTDVVEFNETIGDYEGIEANINIGDLKPGEKREIEYYLYATAEMVNMINRKFTTSVSVKANNMTGTLNSNDIFFRIYKAAFNITNKTNTVETESYTQEKVYNYNITLSNNNQENNVTITVPLPDDAEVTSAYWTGSAFKDTEGIEIQKGKIIAKKLFSLSKKNLIITFKLKEEKERSFSTQVFAQAEDVETKQVLDFYYSNEQFIYTCVAKLEGTQKQPEKVYVKEGENFYYNFEIKTSEKGSHTNFILEDTLPEEVELIKGEVVIIDTQTGKQVAIKEIKEIGNKITVKIPRVEAQNIIEIKFLVKGYLNSKNDDGKAIINKATISSDQVEKTEINSVTQYLEYYENAYANPITGRFPNSGTSGSETGTNSQDTYKITGTVWNDRNKDGQKEDTEMPLSGVEVMLLYKKNNQIVQDITTNENKIVKTNNNGQYEFTNLKPNEYLVVFLHDASKYSVTQYQKEGVGQSFNSDAINIMVVLKGEQRYAGVTDTIKLSDSNIRDIDMGVYEADKFDLRLDKYINKITLTTPTIGTKTYNYTNSKLEKVEILSKNINKSSVIVEYKIVIKNEGQIPGYAKKIIDYLPEGASFNTEINKDWYLAENNKNVYSTSLEETLLKPGESKEVVLTLIFNITDKNIGKIVNNTAEIYETYNEQGVNDYDSTVANKGESEDDISKADIIFAVVTGKIMLYVSLSLTVMAMLIIGIYQIRKRVLNK